MIKVSEQNNVISLIKLILLSLIFCLPKAPAEFESNNHFFNNISSIKTNIFLVPSNGHFEQKVLKKIPLLEGINEITYFFFIPLSYLLDSSILSYSFIKISHFITSTLARGPPLHL